MPELPEVETTRRGISPHMVNQRIRSVCVRESRLRWPVPPELARVCQGSTIRQIDRRGKYLIFRLDKSALLVHLGMSGSLRVISGNRPPAAHDHLDLVLENGLVLRYRDPRRFGAFLLMTEETHPLLAHLGPEPLDETFNGDYLYDISRKKKQAIKSLIMDSRRVTGVGNIYACESLFMAGIRPGIAAGRLTRKQATVLVSAIKKILSAAIARGGTTLRDFVQEDGSPGYFKQSLMVYGRAGLDCYRCQTPLREIRQAGRSSVYCPACQS